MDANRKLDGLVQSVTLTQVSTTTPIVSYTYGTTAPAPGAIDCTYGQPVIVVDNLSGVTQSIGYVSSGGGLGQVAAVSESGGPAPSYTSTYTYTDTGDRDTATYATPNGTTVWKYTDYIRVGDAVSAKRAFERLILVKSGNPSAEEYDYGYDSEGRVRDAAFAQTPATGFTPAAGSYWYDRTNQAQSRARARYTFDDGGRPLSVVHLWDTLNGTNYNSANIIGQTAAYELSGLNRGLKTSATTYVNGTGGFTATHADSYGYDPSLDYLTNASYGDGLPGASASWTYDAAGNRADTVADNLNRPVSISGVSCTSDILGNRLTTGSNTYTWDALNRLLTYNTTSYVYRADGMRMKKSNSSGSTIYRYDGQMGIEDEDRDGTGTLTKVSNYAVGARGIDAISTTSGGTTTVSYPLYDLHGNMVSTLTRSGSSYSYTAERSFDAWGQIRLGAHPRRSQRQILRKPRPQTRRRVWACVNESAIL